MADAFVMDMRAQLRREDCSVILRPYQQRTLDQLYTWWMQRPGITGDAHRRHAHGQRQKPSVVIAELCRLLFDTWPQEHPRTVVLVPITTPIVELAEQNAAKLRSMLPSHLSVGYYSASLGRKVPDADVIVATIGSIYRDAHLLGNIKVVVVDECHLINRTAPRPGASCKFLTELARLCGFRVVGYTATPFRGNGVADRWQRPAVYRHRLHGHCARTAFEQRPPGPAGAPH